MASYPAITIDASASSQDPVRMLQVDEWPDGSVRGRDFSTRGMWKWKIFHLEVSDTEKATLKTFYEANDLRSDVSLLSPWDGVTYNNILFTSVPRYESKNGLWNVSIEMRQVAP